MRQFIVFFSLIFSPLFGFAGDKSENTQKTFWSGDECSKSFSSLRFLDYGDTSMKPKGSASCSGMGCMFGGTNVDPFSYEWGGPTKGLYGLTGGVTRTLTSGRYTYCSSDPSDHPAYMCAKMMSMPGSQNALNTNWEGTECKCQGSVQGHTSNWESCTPEYLTQRLPEVIKEIRRKHNLPEENEAANCVSGLVPVPGGAEGQCACPANPTVPVSNSSSAVANCSNKKMSNEELQRRQEEAAAALAAQQEQEARRRVSAYRSCTSRIVSEFQNNCSRASSHAVEACDIESDANSGNQAIAESINTASRAHMLSKANTGARDQCFKGGLIASTAVQALRGDYHPGCTEALGACDENCNFDERVTARIETQCESILNAGSVQIPEGTTAHQLMSEEISKFSNSYSQPSASADNSINECKVTAREKEGRAVTMMNSVDNAYNASAICQCQLSVNPGIACNAIPTVAQCRVNAETPGCELYANFAVCAVGTPTYNAALCNCVNNPQAEGCATNNVRTTLANTVRDSRNMGGPSGFASGVRSVMGASGSNKSGDIDFDSMNGSSQVDPNSIADLDGSGRKGGRATNGDASNFGSGTGLSGGFSSGAGSSQDQGGVSSAADSENNGVGGAFNQLRTAVANMLGLGRKSGSHSFSSRAPGNSEEVDPKKFKPKRLRGLKGSENENGIGASNMDIWKMMNLCTRGDSCPSNIDGYIKEP